MAEYEDMYNELLDEYIKIEQALSQICQYLPSSVNVDKCCICETYMIYKDSEDHTNFVCGTIGCDQSICEACNIDDNKCTFCKTLCCKNCFLYTYEEKYGDIRVCRECDIERDMCIYCKSYFCEDNKCIVVVDECNIDKRPII